MIVHHGFVELQDGSKWVSRHAILTPTMLRVTEKEGNFKTLLEIDLATSAVYGTIEYGKVLQPKVFLIRSSQYGDRLFLCPSENDQVRWVEILKPLCGTSKVNDAIGEPQLKEKYVPPPRSEQLPWESNQEEKRSSNEPTVRRRGYELDEK